MIKKKEFKAGTKKVNIIVLNFVKWLGISFVIGLVLGIIGGAFCYAIGKATEFRHEHVWIIALLPIAGVAVAGIYKLLGLLDDKGTNSILNAVRAGEKLSIKMMLAIMASTILTHLFGGSAGREGAALQMGGSFAAKVGNIIHLTDKDQRIMVMCGMSAGFAALFGTPVTSAVFAMEVVVVGIMNYSAIVPCIVSAVTASFISSQFGMTPTRFDIPEIPDLTAPNVLKIGVIAILCALVSILFCLSLKYTSLIFKKKIPDTLLRAFIGGAIVAALALILQTDIYNGIGSRIIARAFTEKMDWYMFLLKIAFTAITLGSGFKGGEIVPTLFIGATFGNIMGQLLGADMGLCTAVGMVAVFCGVTNCPIASLVLGVEMFGSADMIYFAIAIAISYTLSGYYALYSDQKMLGSKKKPIDFTKIFSDERSV